MVKEVKLLKKMHLQVVELKQGHVDMSLICLLTLIFINGQVLDSETMKRYCFKSHLKHYQSVQQQTT